MSSSSDSSDYDDYTDSEEETEPISWNKLKDGWQEFLVDENAFFIVPTNETLPASATAAGTNNPLIGGPATSPTTVIQIDDNGFKDPLGILKIPPRKAMNSKSHLISLESEQFDPVVFLSEIHSQTKFTELSVGLSKLKEESTSKDLEIKLLVKDNFEHFVKCKDTVDEVYTLISSSSMLQDMTTSFTKIMDKSSVVYDPLLLGKKEADRIRKVLALLNKFKFIFKLPGKILDNIKQGEFDKIIHNYKNAKSLITTNNKKVFQKVLLDIERIIEEFRGQLYASLRDPQSKPDYLKKAIRVLMEIGNGKGEWAMIGDPCWYCLSNKHKAIITLIKQCHEDKSLPHHKRIQRLSILLLSNIPNLYKMGRAYVEGRFDIKDSEMTKKNTTQNQLLPATKAKEAKSITVVVHYLDESFSSYSVTDDKKIKDLISMCMKRFPDSENEYRMYKLSEKKGKGDQITKIKLVELEPDASPYKLYKKITDKKHKFLFKKISQEYSKNSEGIHVIQKDVNSSFKSHKKQYSAATSAMNEENFKKLVIELLQLYSNKVEDLFFDDDNSEDVSSDDMTSNMVENVNEVIKCLEMLVGLRMPDTYLESIRQLVESLTLHFVNRICSEMIGEVSFLYLLEDWAINDDAQSMIISANQVDGMVTTRLLDEFFDTVKSSLTQLSVLATNPALLKHVEKALCEAIESFGDCLHHLVFESSKKDIVNDHEEEEPIEQISETRKVLLSLSNCSTVVSKTAIQLRDYYVLLFHQPCSHRIKRVIEKLGVLEKMIFEKYVQEKNLEFSDLVSKGILYSGIDWCNKNPPIGISSFVMVLLTKIVFIHNEVMKTINSIDVTNGIITRIFEYLLISLQYNFDKLDPLYISQSGQAQFLLDIQFIEKVLSPFSNDKIMKLSTSIRRYISSMKKRSDDKPININLELIIKLQCEKSSLLFLCLNDNLKK